MDATVDDGSGPAPARTYLSSHDGRPHIHMILRNRGLAAGSAPYLRPWFSVALDPPAVHASSCPWFILTDFKLNVRFAVREPTSGFGRWFLAGGVNSQRRPLAAVRVSG
jgi:hypothetical protein